MVDEKPTAEASLQTATGKNCCRAGSTAADGKDATGGMMVVIGGRKYRDVNFADCFDQRGGEKRRGEQTKRKSLKSSLMQISVMQICGNARARRKSDCDKER